jgi:hypothetical protein
MHSQKRADVHLRLFPAWNVDLRARHFHRLCGDYRAHLAALPDGSSKRMRVKEARRISVACPCGVDGLRRNRLYRIEVLAALYERPLLAYLDDGYLAHLRYGIHRLARL